MLLKRAEVDEISFALPHSEDVVRHPVVARISCQRLAKPGSRTKRKAALAAERKRESPKVSRNRNEP